MVKTNFLSDKMPKENVHYTCIACITIGSVRKMKKMISISLLRRMQIQNKEKISKFINTKLESESELDFDTEPKSEL